MFAMVLSQGRRLGVLLLIPFLAACGGGGSSGSSAGGETLGTQVLEPAASLNYHQHTKSIIDSRCVTCHREGSQSPFSLEGYSRVESKRSAIAYVLEAGSMPVPGFAPLTNPEKALLMQWLEAGAPEGNASSVARATPYTYYADAKTIIDTRCANCHRPGEIAPFSLTDFESVFSVRAAIAHQVTTGAMPPWPPTDNYFPIKNKRSLSDEERAVLLSWLAGGAPEGDPHDFVPKDKNQKSIDYNLTVRLNEPYTPTERPDEYRCLVIDWPLDRTVYVNAVNLVPGVKAEVHHVFAVVVDPDKLGPIEAADGADGKPGFPCWGAPSPEGGLVPPRTLTVWAPGISPGALPDGTGVRVDPGSKIVMQMHYNTVNTEPLPDQSSLDIRYVDEVDREAVTLFFLDVGWYPAGGMPIPAGDPNVTHQHTAHFGYMMDFSGAGDMGITSDEPFVLHSVFMHQHV
ncbi:MAG: hypothetical protein HRT77_02840, partial [Halioglobus sp.]|nr:hypothetical protein [Halioglobus sp.]